MSFSKRTSWPRALNVQARSEAPRFDLTHSNPTTAGFPVPDAWLDALSNREGARYTAEAQGSLAARQAVVRYYAERGANVHADDVVLTCSSSEAYALLFTLFGDPGDAVLVPEPSYPLFPFLLDVAGLQHRGYPLIREERWRVDTDAVARGLASPNVAALLVVHPQNPTGSMIWPRDADALAALCCEAEVPVIVDEVFLDYRFSESFFSDDAGCQRGLAEERRHGTFAGRDDASFVVISGLSKVALAPQLKLSWLVLGGKPAFRDEARARLEILADTFLSVTTAVQLAAPEVLANLDARQTAVRGRLRDNLAELDRCLAALGPSCPIRRLALDGGWYVMLEVPRTHSEDEWVALAATEAGCRVQPGYYYDCPQDGTLVLSLLTPPDAFGPGVAALVSLLAG